MPHTKGKRYAVVSCHVERPLDDDCWRHFSRIQERRPGGFAIAALLRPPEGAAGEDGERWPERAREAAQRGPLGHHTHFVGPTHARPTAESGGAAQRVRAEALWMREQGLEPRFFCGGGWYIDEEVAAVVAEVGYADCTGIAFVPSYLPEDEPLLAADEPLWLTLSTGQRLLELPATHSLGMAARGATRLAPALRPRVLPRHRPPVPQTPTRAVLRARAAVAALPRDRSREPAKRVHGAPRAGLRPTLTLPWQASLRPRSSPPARRRNAATSETSGARSRSSSLARNCAPSSSASAALPSSSSWTSAASRWRSMPRSC